MPFVRANDVGNSTPRRTISRGEGRRGREPDDYVRARSACVRAHAPRSPSRALSLTRYLRFLGTGLAPRFRTRITIFSRSSSSLAPVFPSFGGEDTGPYLLAASKLSKQRRFAENVDRPRKRSISIYGASAFGCDRASPVAIGKQASITDCHGFNAFHYLFIDLLLLLTESYKTFFLQKI